MKRILVLPALSVRVKMISKASVYIIVKQINHIQNPSPTLPESQNYVDVNRDVHTVCQ